MLFFPLGVDVQFDRRPVMNYVLIGLSLFVFCLQMTDAVSYAFVLDGFSISGLIGHMWLHNGIIHLAGNLWFLYVFGNAVCAKVGNAAFLGLYLFFGLAAAVVHLLAVGGSAVGASGAINGVVGMYVVYYPLNKIACLAPGYRTYSRLYMISGFWIIGLWFMFDIIGAAVGSDRVGYFAHLGGFVAGVVSAIVLERTGWLRKGWGQRSLVEIMDDYQQRRSESKASERLKRRKIRHR